MHFCFQAVISHPKWHYQIMKDRTVEIRPYTSATFAIRVTIALAFRTQGQVKIHERKHNGIKPFKCEFCEKTFAYRESLLTHVSIHTGLKRFMCQACGSRFSCISNLQAHRKSHKTTCGMTPNVTKPVGPMGHETIFKISEVSNS
ncbi:hypothetical protein HA402_000844 [Bradysia odoriphaga]|nr:hypothetical protein HA402_000844 [Bradysia odoriphaga]